LGENHCHEAVAAQTDQAHDADIKGLGLRVDHEEGVDQQDGNDHEEDDDDVEDKPDEQDRLIEDSHAG
jgi:hypothetical protein